MLPQDGKIYPVRVEKNTNFYPKPHIKRGLNLVYPSVRRSASPTYELIFLLTNDFMNL